jgi:hypothetical protein
MNRRTKKQPQGRRPLLEVAIERGEWELAALCLLNGLLVAAQKLPPEGVDAPIDLLVIKEHPRARHCRERNKGRRHGRA